MTLRRPLVAVAFSALAGLFVHAACFGTAHLAGGAHASELFGAVGAALGLIALAATFAAATGMARTTRRSPPVADVLGIGLGGIVAYAAIELAEGHAALGGGLRVAITALPAAFAVLGLRRLGGRVCALAGTRVARLFPLALRRRAAHLRRGAAAAHRPRLATPARGSFADRAPPRLTLVDPRPLAGRSLRFREDVSCATDSRLWPPPLFSYRPRPLSPERRASFAAPSWMRPNPSRASSSRSRVTARI